jgi:hypothetical protein
MQKKNTMVKKKEIPIGNFLVKKTKGKGLSKVLVINVHYVTPIIN